ncbi:arylacetamide deacetylase-like 4 [Mustela nigripes]|uniref:arylacetamide deacetylase-like 4 n=1 Tax=Mustela nigripes TaxID=77151 RepID=UPI002814BF9C|nr:arylacetamide deacetylase-like 4 [Mustela nigripes]
MLILGLALLGSFFVGIFIWAVLQHFLTADIPSTLQYPTKLRFLHCVFLYMLTLAEILEKLGICSMLSFLKLLQVCVRIKKDDRLTVTDLYFGTIPVRLFQPKAASSGPRRGIIFFPGGGGFMGSLDFFHNLSSLLVLETDSVLLLVGYRKLPDHHYPSIYQDCLNASIHFLKTLKSYGVDPSRVVLCGDSIGGGHVASVTQALVGRSDLPQIKAQVLVYPVTQLINLQLPSHWQNRNVPFLSRKFMMTCVFKYMVMDFHWWDAILGGTFIPPEFWRKYQKWLSADNLPSRFRKPGYRPLFPGPFNEAAYLENKHLLDVVNTPLLRDDETIAQLPAALVVSCEHDILRDDALLYMKRLEDQGVPVTWYHVEDGFHGSFLFSDKKFFSFPCSLKIRNAVIGYIKSI